MNYKLLALDFDGTLLPYGNAGGVSPAVLSALREARAAGIILCAATGRSLAEAGPALQCMDGLFHYAVMSNGAQVYRMPGELLVSHTFKREESDLILGVMQKYPGLFFQTFIDGEPYCEDSLWRQAHMLPLLERYGEMAGKPLASVPSFSALFERVGSPSKFFLLAESAAQAKTIAEELSSLGIETTCSADDNVEILPRGIGKVSGLEMVCELLGITRSEVMAIGDSSNDLSMLQFAGFGIAMGNAPDSVKAAGDAVTASVEEDGAALAIERHLLVHA